MAMTSNAADGANALAGGQVDDADVAGAFNSLASLWAIIADALLLLH
jgi:hypothetical protein